jgi:hypothetical protein
LFARRIVITKFKELQEIEIFAGKLSTSAARQIFRQLFRSIGRYAGSIARQPNLWPALQASARTMDLPDAKQMPCTR